jgi:hypothetical protein
MAIDNRKCNKIMFKLEVIGCAIKVNHLKIFLYTIKVQLKESPRCRTVGDRVCC